MKKDEKQLELEPKPMTPEEQKTFLDTTGLGSMDASSMNAYIEQEAKKQGINPGPRPSDVISMASIDDKVAKGADLDGGKDDKKKVEAKVEEKKEPEESVTFKQDVEVSPGKYITVEGATEDECKRKADLVSKAAEAAQPAKPAEKKVDAPVVDAGKLAELGRKLQEGRVEAIDEYLEANPKVIEKIIGAPLSELKSLLQKQISQKEVQPWQDATTKFKEEHPEYETSKRNQLLMQYQVVQVKAENPDLSPAEALNESYRRLTEDKMLDVKTSEPAKEEPAKEVTVEPAKKKATSSTIPNTDGGQHTKPTPVTARPGRRQITEADIRNAKDSGELAALVQAYNQQMGMTN